MLSVHLAGVITWAPDPTALVCILGTHLLCWLWVAAWLPGRQPAGRPYSTCLTRPRGAAMRSSVALATWAPVALCEMRQSYDTHLPISKAQSGVALSPVQ